jgi:transposase
LNARALVAFSLIGKTVSKELLRKIYKLRRITPQKLRARLGAPNLPSTAYQQNQITKMKSELESQTTRGYYVVQVDECTFNTKDLSRRHWAPIGDPFTVAKRFENSDTIAVVAAISASEGLVCQMQAEGSFNAEDMVELLQKIRIFYGKEKVAVFWDNASIHRAGIVLEAAEKADIPLVFNLPYRPDLNGIELLWRKAKNTFYRLMDSFRVNGVHASVAGTV